MPREPRRFSLGLPRRRWRRQPLTLGVLLLASMFAFSSASIAPVAQAAGHHAQHKADHHSQSVSTPFGTDEAGEPGIDDEAIPEPGQADLIQLVIAPENADLSSPDEQLRLRMVIRNQGESELSEGTVSITIDPQRVGAPQSDADQPLPADPVASSGISIAEERVAVIGGGGQQTLSANFTISDLPIDFSAAEPGVYEIRAQLSFAPNADSDATSDTETDAGDADSTEPSTNDAGDSPALDAGEINFDTETALATRIATTRIVWRGSEITTPVPLTMVVPFVLPQSVETMPTRSELAALSSRLDILLSAAESYQATLAIDPRIIAAIRAYGSESPASALQLLDRLEHTELSHFLLQYADADPSAQAALGADSLMAPTGFSFVTQSAGNTTENSVGNADGNPESNSDTADSDSDSDSDSDENHTGTQSLTSWERGFAGAWPAADSVNTQTLQLLDTSGINTVLLNSSNVTAVGGTRFTIPGFEAITGIVADADLAAAARSALRAGGDIERDAARAQLATALALSAQQLSPGQVLAFDRSAIAESDSPKELLDWVSGLNWVSVAPLDGQPLGTGTVIPGSSSPERLNQLEAAGARSASIVRLAPLLEHPEYLDQFQRMRMLWTLRTGFASDDTAFAEVMAEQQAQDSVYLRGVQIVSTATTRLVGTTTQLPVQLHNSLPFNTSVLMHVSPLSAAISVSQPLIGPTSVVAGGNSTVLVPVHSRVSSGNSALFVQLSDTANTSRFVTVTLPLTLQTSLEAILLASLGVIAALLLGLGIWRSVRRRRSQRNNPAVG